MRTMQCTLSLSASLYRSQLVMEGGIEGRYKERNMGDLSCKKEEKERKGGTGQKGMKERVIW